jgi:uncharacterized protein YcfJ
MAKFTIINVDGKHYIDVNEAAQLIKEACQQQREICEAVAVHHKFGWYKFKKGSVVNANEPRVIINELQNG